ncbi:MAG: hypothetical protein NTX25_04480 [Proteobacteria bacterium]|nr:hypothetical protein [Pseudomonadota bacterium]
MLKIINTCFVILVAGYISPLSANDFVIPVENQNDQHLAAIQPFDAKAKLLLQAIEIGNIESVQELFFPQDAFLQLKAIAKPLEYYQQLVRWYKKDLQKESERFKGQGHLDFVAIKGGGCKWKAAGSEANKIPYWSCYKRRMEIQVGGKPASIQLHAMINWGGEWYLTHLGPIPKS